MTATGDPNGHVQLAGTVWQAYDKRGPAPRYDWYEDIYPTANPSALQVTFGNVPPPPVAAFLATHWAQAASPAWRGLGGQNTCFLDASAGGDPDRIRLFKTARIAGDWSLDIQSGQPVEVRVSGIAIWMLDSGFRSSRSVRVTGTANDLLVVCVKKTNDSSAMLHYGVKGVGMVFMGGLESVSVPVILVTDGYVAIDSRPLPTVRMVHCVIGWASIYADFAWIGGPDQGSGMFAFWHGSRVLNPQADANLQKLLARGLLPGAPGVIAAADDSEGDSLASGTPVREHQAGSARLALLGVVASPGRDQLSVRFSLRNSRPAVLAVFDIAGRRLAERRLEDPGAGTHAVDFPVRGELGAGVYFVRLTQAGRSVKKRLIVMR